MFETTNQVCMCVLGILCTDFDMLNIPPDPPSESLA